MRIVGPEMHAAAAAMVWHLSQLGPLRLSDLAVHLRVDSSVASRQVAELVAAGYARRQPDPRDGRAQLVQVTAAGREALDHAEERVRGKFRLRLSGRSAPELRQVARTLASLRHDLLEHTHEPSVSPGDSALHGNACSDRPFSQVRHT